LGEAPIKVERSTLGFVHKCIERIIAKKGIFAVHDAIVQAPEYPTTQFGATLNLWRC